MTNKNVCTNMCVCACVEKIVLVVPSYPYGYIGSIELNHVDKTTTWTIPIQYDLKEVCEAQSPIELISQLHQHLGIDTQYLTLDNIEYFGFPLNRLIEQDIWLLLISKLEEEGRVFGVHHVSVSFDQCQNSPFTIYIKPDGDPFEIRKSEWFQNYNIVESYCEILE